MKKSLKTPWVLALVALATQSFVSADQTQLPISRATGIVAVSAPAGITHLGLPIIAEPVITPQTITGVAGNTLTVAGAAFGDFTSAPHSVQIIGGQQNGIILPISASTATTITAGETLPGGVKVNLDRLIVIPDWTLTAGTYSLQLENVLTGGTTNDATVDTVEVENDGVVTKYYYNTTSSAWFDFATNTVAAGVVRIPALRGVRIIRPVGATTEDIVVHGVLRSGTQKAFRPAASTRIYSNPFLSDVTLGNSGLAALLTISANPAQAEKVTLADNGVAVEYFIQAGGNWKLVSNPDGPNQNGVLFKAGTAALVSGAPVIQTQTWPRRWRFGRPARSFLPPPAVPADSFWSAQETFTTGS
jgi:hypothetical protein